MMINGSDRIGLNGVNAQFICMISRKGNENESHSFIAMIDHQIYLKFLLILPIFNPSQIESQNKCQMNWKSELRLLCNAHAVARVSIVSLRKWQTNMENFLAGNSLAGFRLPLPQHVGTWRRWRPPETGSIQTLSSARAGGNVRSE